MKVWILISSGFVVGGLLYVLYVVLKGWFLVREAPRADMFICEKGHGPLPKSALINFMGQDYCSICFHQRLKAAERGK